MSTRQQRFLQILVSASFFLFVVKTTDARIAPNHVRPEAKISSTGEVLVIWETLHPTAHATVFYTPEVGSNRSPFPDYHYRIEEKVVAKAHSTVLKDIQPNIIYHYRVSCIDSVTWTEIRSADYTFRVIEENGKRRLSLVITEGPVVALVTTNSVVIGWKTNLPSSGAVKYWSGINRKPKIVKSQKSSATEFEVKIEALAINRSYQYKIRSVSAKPEDQIESQTFSFRTAPDENIKTFKFLVMNDSRGGTEPDPDHRLNGVNYPVLNKLANKALIHDARFVLFAGDLITGYTQDKEDAVLQYETWKKAVAFANAFVPFYVTMGNHDASAPHQLKDDGKTAIDPPSPNSAEELFAEQFVLPTNGPEPQRGNPPYRENVYSFDFGNVHLVALNSNYFYGVIDRVDGPQRAWLQEDLKNNRMKHSFVYFHMPCYPAGGHYRSSLDVHPADRDSLWQIFDELKVTGVFAGHEHNYSRLKVDHEVNPQWKNTIFQIVTGRAGAPSYPQDLTVPYVKNVIKFSRDINYAIVTVSGKQVQVEIYNDLEEKIDEFKLRE